MKYIIALDIAFRKSGVCVLDEQGNIVLKETIVIPTKLDYTAGVKALYDRISGIYATIEENFSPKEITTVVEDVLGAVHIKAALAIHAGRTAAVLAYHHSHNSNKQIAYYTPNDIKLWLGGKRGAKKDAVLSGLKSRFPQYDYDSLTEDEVDALALALYHKRKG